MQLSPHRRANRGMTVPEFVLVLLVALLLAAWAIGNFVKAQTRPSMSRCILNLKQIEGAKEAWALENKLSKGTPVNDGAINGYLKNSVLPQCPAGGTYTLEVVGTPPTCSMGKPLGVGHVIR